MVASNFNDADWLSVLAHLAGGDALSSASSVSVGNDVAASDINAAFRSDSENNSHRFADLRPSLSRTGVKQCRPC